MHEYGASEHPLPSARVSETRDSDTAPTPRSPAAFSPDTTFVYDLRSEEHTSDAFYAELAPFAEEVVAQIEKRAGYLLDGYGRHVREVLSESPRSRGEYALELLSLGMILRKYESAATATPAWTAKLGQALVRVRHRIPLLKPIADKTRALLACFWFAPAIDSPRRPTLSRPPFDRLTLLIHWLRATGEFEQEALRLSNWRAYFTQLRPSESAYWMGIATVLFDRFEREAAVRFGDYTRGVGPFIAGDYAHRGIREDRLFCGRTQSEYHLNMVAAEIMNLGLREAFERTKQKAVLVPACLRGAKAAACRARLDGVDMTCTACDPACAVNRITQRMRILGAKVYLVAHTKGFSRWLDRWQREPGVGVTAVACLLNILPGGYEMRSRGIASQCVPLDYPGCRKHWSSKGIATSVNEDRLVKIVAASASAAPMLRSST
ncbi:MAG: DUF116 domain-containing protein [Terracidiphilus sp.]